MKEVSNRFVVILVIIALVISLVGTYLVTKNVIESDDDNQQNQVELSMPDSSDATVTLNLVDDNGENDNG